MVWDDENIKQLIKLWEKGLSTTEIAKKMNVSKNSVVGKVHRLCLKARPSPIKKKNVTPEVAENVDNTVAPVEEVKVTKTTNKKTKPEAEKTQASVENEKQSTKKTAEAEVKETEVVKEVSKAPEKKKTENVLKGNIKLVELDSHTCRWPLGDPRDEDFCFCGKRVRAGQTYCDEHAQVAYVKATTKR